MKRLALVLTSLLCLCLLLFPSAALNGAKVGIGLWWEQVFPALLPFFICCGMLERLGFLSLFYRRERLRLLPVFLFGALAGYPGGARLLGSCVERSALNRKEAQTMSYITNLCSPVFIMTILSLGLYKNKSVFLPLFVSHVLTIAIFSALLKLPVSRPLSRTGLLPVPEAFAASIAEAMLSLLKVGGCIAICAVVSECLFTVTSLSSPLARALIGGCIELTYGCRMLLETGLNLRFQLAFSAFFTAFGGFSIALQSLCFLKLANPLRYLGVKFAMGLCAGLVCYLIAPLLVPREIALALSIGKRELTNAITTAGILFCSVVSLSFALLFALIVKGKALERKPKEDG
ncbi:MAG: hypothetical protein Q4C04_00615 [Clostridia bacterium]|nr:hypothetical protein [Clostridia bacterium]